jgi:type IX secretion system PorP/SprF family membrane protein
MNNSYTRILFVLIAFSCSGILFAQQDPQYSQFMHNKLMYNPAFAGNGDKFCATLLQRTQWVGFGGGNEMTGTTNPVPRGAAPTNLVGSFSAPIGKRFGLGLNLLRDELGFELSVVPSVSIAYKQPLKNDAQLAIGFNVGYMQKSLDGEKLKALEPGDPKIPSSNVNGNATDFGFGLYYTKPQLAIFDNFYAGLSASHLNQAKLTYEWNGGSRQIQNVMHYYFVAGAEYNLSSTITLQPNILVKKDPAKIQTDFNCYAIWNQKLRGGLTWRPMDAVSVLAGYQMGNNLYVGYSYDLTTSRILNYSAGSHEFLIRYCFGIKYTPVVRPPVPVLTPRFM